MEADAKAYNEMNQPQIDEGIKFIRELNLPEGAKVIDIGCGTGDVTKYIADIVGSEGEVVGIDPDEARIKIAKEKFNKVGNLQFLVSSSATGFPHDDQPYYNVHISTAVFHWVGKDEKKLYLQKAYQCLKPGGKLAISCGLLPEKMRGQADQLEKFKTYPLTKDGYRKLFEDVGLFPNVVVEETVFLTRFASLEEFKRWMKASTHNDLDEMDESPKKDLEMFKEIVTVAEDGSVVYKSPYAKITASKI